MTAITKPRGRAQFIAPPPRVRRAAASRGAAARRLPSRKDGCEIDTRCPIPAGLLGKLSPEIRALFPVCRGRPRPPDCATDRPSLAEPMGMVRRTKPRGSSVNLQPAARPRVDPGRATPRDQTRDQTPGIRFHVNLSSSRSPRTGLQGRPPGGRVTTRETPSSCRQSPPRDHPPKSDID